MYKNAIKKAIKYTRPLLIGKLQYKDFKVINDIGTMIILNKHNDILTTSHVADTFFKVQDYNEVFPPILKEIDEAKPKHKEKIKEKYGITDDSIIGMQTVVVDITDALDKITIIKHNYLDLAIISFHNKDDDIKGEYPIFAKNNAECGENLCSIGFAFPEYTAFKYNHEKYKLSVEHQFMNFPIYPISGMMCRNIIDKKDKLTMFEMSNIVLKGQEGGPIVNPKGEICGIILTSRNTSDEYGTFRSGLAINNSAIKEFLDDNNIEYEVAK